MTAVPRKRLRFIRDEVEFRQHQVEGVRKGSKMKSFILGDDMGLGKTIQALTIAAIDFEQGKADRFLVVCPASLTGNWLEEIEKFTKFRAMILDGTPEKRAKQLRQFIESQSTPEPYHCLILGYEKVRIHLAELNEIGWHLVLMDEAHMIKGHDTERTEALHNLRGNRFIIMTGSPLLNHVHELWPLLHRIRPASYPNYYAFVHRYVVFGGYQKKQPVGTKNEPELRKRLADVMIRRLKSECLDLPPKEIIQVKVDMHPRQAAIYKRLRDEHMIELPDDPDPQEIEHALSRYTYLKQIAATTFAIDPETDFSGKLDEAIRRWLVLQDAGYKVIWFTQFRSVMECIANRIEAVIQSEKLDPRLSLAQVHGGVAGPKRQGIVREWTDEKVPQPIGMMLQVATGFNMTASSNQFFIDKLFVPKLNEQAQDRSWRIGTTESVMCYEFMARGTVEARIERILATKSALFGRVVDDADFKRKLAMMLRASEDEDDE